MALILEKPTIQRVVEAMGLKPFLMSLLAMMVSGCQTAQESSPLHRVVCFPVDGSQDSICLFRDKGLGNHEMDSLWTTGEDSGHAQSEVRRLSPAGKSLATLTLQPLAKLEQARISGKQFFLATEDLSVGAGSYNGPLTHVLDVSRPGRIDQVLDDHGNEILPMSSLKSAWKLVPDGILEASCGPDTDIIDSVTFLRTYDRLRLRDGKWIRSSRVDSGYEDFGDVEFPTEDLFPK